MTRQEKNKKIRQRKELLWLAFSCIICAIVFLTTTIKIFAPINNKTTVFVFLGIFLGLIMGGLILTMISGSILQDINSYSTKLKNKRQYFHSLRLFNTIKDKKFEKAIDIYNDFIVGNKGPAALCNGIIIGALYVADDKYKENMIKRMEDICDI